MAKEKLTKVEITQVRSTISQTSRQKKNYFCSWFRKNK